MQVIDAALRRMPAPFRPAARRAWDRALTMRDRNSTTRFHKAYYRRGPLGGTWKDTYWMGIQTQKCPLDLWIYQEILYEIRPDLIVECGTARGGSALYLASMCELLSRGEVLTIDIEASDTRPSHSRIRYLTGSSTDPRIVADVAAACEARTTVLVILDSDHSARHVLAELRAYGPLVTAGSYLIVEDTNVNGHPVFPNYGPGPMEAVHTFLSETSDFRRDRAREKLLLTFNPKGYLRRVSPVHAERPRASVD
jgi:cephalosporin hydroxylase